MLNKFSRPLMIALLGVCCSFLAAGFLSDAIILVLGGISLLIAIPFICMRRGRRWAICVFVPIVLALMYFAAFRHVAVEPIRALAGKDLIVKGRVISLTQPQNKSPYVVVRTDTVSADGDVIHRKSDLLIYVKDDVLPAVGAQIRCTGTAFENEENEYRFSYRDTLGQYLTVYSEDVQTIAAPSRYDWHVWTASAVSHIYALYEKCCDPEVAAFLRALSLGQKDKLSENLYFKFQSVGAAHMLAVSGMHLAFLVMLLWAILSFATPNIKLRAVIMMAAIWCFAAITGFSPSCTRSAIMLTIFQIGVLVDRESDPFTSLAVAVFVCVVTNPLRILNPGLLLSATSTLGILLLTPHLLSLFPKIRRSKIKFGALRIGFRQTICMSVAALVGSLPVMVLMFRFISPISPITNLLIMLPIEALFLLSFAVAALGWIAPIRFVLRYVTRWLYLFCKWVVSVLSSFSFATVSTQNIAFWIYIALLLLSITCMIFALHNRHFRYVAGGVCILFVLFIGGAVTFDYLNADRVGAYYIDVGQGNTTLLSAHHEGILIDCGGSDNGLREINRVLLETGTRKIKALFVTHFDTDHIRYADDVLARYDVECLYVPERLAYDEPTLLLLRQARMLGTTVKFISQDQSFAYWENTSIRALSRHFDLHSAGENANSLVYSAQIGTVRLLFCGDVPLTAERKLIAAYGGELACDVLEVSHHGSDTATGTEFLQSVRPDTAVVSVGKNNGYKLPSDSVMRRLRYYCNSVLRTDEEHTICLFIRNNTFTVQKGN